MRNILLAVTGGTPQIITETLYGLLKAEPPVYIDEVHVITTAFGKRLLKDTLLKEKVLDRFIKDFNLPPIEFSERHIYTIKKNNTPLEDILTMEDSKVTAELITKTVTQLTADDSTALHCSIAGGRKTMSFYLGMAIQMFGRPQDRLYHVLVCPEFENNPAFFYPPPEPLEIECTLRNGTRKKLSTARAWVQLVELPFIRLREKFSVPEMEFEDAIREVQRCLNLSLKQRSLKIPLKSRLLIVGDIKIPLPPMALSLYAFLAYQKKSNCRKNLSICESCTECYLKLNELTDKIALKKIMKIYQFIYPNRASDDRWTEYIQRGGLPENIVRQTISKINRAIKNAIPEPEAGFYVVSSNRVYGETTYGIKLDRTMIEVSR